MHTPRAALFDLDDTLAESFESPSPEMINRVISLLQHMPVAIVTGRDFPWMAQDFLPQIARSGHTEHFFVLPEGAAQCLQWEAGAWQERYGWSLADDERARIKEAVTASIAETGLLAGLPIFGDQFIQKRAMIAFAALGRDVPADMKRSWDPDNSRRAALRISIAAKLPEYDVLMGGATSTDITKKGVNKSYGVRWLSEHLHMPPADMLYVGDALYPGGNDFVVIETGIQTRTTSGPKETSAIIDELLAVCKATG